jgi:N-acetylglucosaminyl-diphospho-decaprenol L-rhamnosyltransferase
MFENGKYGLRPMIGSRITAIIVTHDSAAVLDKCLKALRQQNATLIVVDNASTDNSVEIAEKNGALVLRNADNQGFGRAMNLGLSKASTDLVLFINPDLIIAEGALPALEAAEKRYRDAALFGAHLIEPGGRIFFPKRSLLSPYLQNAIGKEWKPSGDCCVPHVSGACMLMRRKQALELGGFDPEIFLFYEDDDLCRRVIEAGHAIIFVEHALAHHDRGHSSSPQAGRAFKARWHLAWSKLYVARKWNISVPTTGEKIKNSFKYWLARLTGNKQRVERYGGTLAGIKAFEEGKTALEHEGLDAVIPPALNDGSAATAGNPSPH